MLLKLLHGCRCQNDIEVNEMDWLSFGFGFAVGGAIFGLIFAYIFSR